MLLMCPAFGGKKTPNRNWQTGKVLDSDMIPYDDPARFDATVERFFREPFVKKDRVKDLFKSYEALIASQQ